jgi:signal peptide peptidase SppA
MGLRSWLKRMMGQSGPVVPVVRLHGVIAADQRPGRLNIETVAPLLKRAFADKSVPAVAIIVNSPGGSPVQSRLIAKRIRDLAEEKRKPVLVFVEDAAASGGYFIAVAGDEIFADPSSIVGSIGVIMAGFGFVDAIGKLGIERRVHTAGRNKSTLDPFQPERPRTWSASSASNSTSIRCSSTTSNRAAAPSSRAPTTPCSPANGGPACAASISA